LYIFNKKFIKKKFFKKLSHKINLSIMFQTNRNSIFKYSKLTLKINSKFMATYLKLEFIQF